MKKIVLLFTALICSFHMYAQELTLAELTAPGKRVFVEFIDVNKNIQDGSAPILNALQGPECNRWTVVSERSEADFILRINMDKKGPGLSNSWGARMFMTPSILSLDGQELWRGKIQKGNANGFTGFNSQEDVARKLVRRSLGEELLKATGSNDGAQQ